MAGIGSGKVIASGPDDYVFVNFADHGAPNLIAFPHGELHAKDLIKTIDYMNMTQRYKQMVFYVEACESGSMFDKNKLAPNINVFATTAANGKESSYACYWDKKRETYLGDVYSVKWMEDSDKADPAIETLQKQFEIVKQETNTSHVQEFGDLSISQEPIGVFQGEGTPSMQPGYPEEAVKETQITDAVPSPDVPLIIMYKRLEKASAEEERREILNEIKVEEDNRVRIKTTVHKIAERLVPHPRMLRQIIETPASPTREYCYQDVVTAFRELCFPFNQYEYALRHIYVLANLCDHGDLDEERIINVIHEVCIMK
jgi:legumain